VPRPLDPRLTLTVPCRKCLNAKGEVKEARRFACEACDGKRELEESVSVSELKRLLADA
jgi:hypothetical protein